MYTDIIKQFKLIQQKLEQAEVILDPWPHMVLDNVFTEEFYNRIIDFESNEQLKIQSTDHGRIERIWHQALVQEFSNEYEQETNKIFQILSKKFNKEYSDEYVPCTTTFWEDRTGFKIVDIHVDAFYDTDFTISGQVYLPKDDKHTHLGTRLFNYVGQDLYSDANQDPGTKFPHTAYSSKEYNFDNIATVSYIPNRMLITTNEPNSWHQAPTHIDADYVRKSLMFRWKV